MLAQTRSNLMMKTAKELSAVATAGLWVLVAAAALTARAARPDVRPHARAMSCRATDPNDQIMPAPRHPAGWRARSCR